MSIVSKNHTPTDFNVNDRICNINERSLLVVKRRNVIRILKENSKIEFKVGKIKENITKIAIREVQVNIRYAVKHISNDRG